MGWASPVSHQRKENAFIYLGSSWAGSSAIVVSLVVAREEKVLLSKRKKERN
jgi:hypothetical protein